MQYFPVIGPIINNKENTKKDDDKNIERKIREALDYQRSLYMEFVKDEVVSFSFIDRIFGRKFRENS